MRKIAVKNHTQEKNLFQRRLIFAVFVIILLSMLLIGRLVDLQVLQHQHYVTLSDRNSLQLLPIEPNRGLICDRNGVLLAENVPTFSLDVIADQVHGLENTVTELQKIIPISDDEIDQFNNLRGQKHGFVPISLKVNLTEEDVAKFSLNQYRFPGVIISPHLLRNYPLAESMLSAVGYVGRISSSELPQLDQNNYSANNFIGKTGIEKYYEDLLHGSTGYSQIEIDAAGHALRTLSYVAPQPGDNVYLTIDSELQKVAMQALGKESGSVVALVPRTGEILTLASNPSIDPNLFVKGLSAKDLTRLQHQEDQPLFNRTIRGQFPLASTIKPYLALTALDNDVITPTFRFYDPGWFKLPNSTHVYRGWDWQYGGHGYVNVTQAIIVSSDPFFYNLSMLLTINRIANILEQFGFGKKTGIDMPDEASGLIPTPEWKLKTLGQSWFPGNTVNSGIGQGYFLISPLQLASAVATIANHGLRFKPHLLYAIKTSSGGMINQSPTPEEPVVLSHPENWNLIIKAMVGVVTSKYPRGTAYDSFGADASYTIAAKTGTAQVYSKHGRKEDASDIKVAKKLRNHSIFVAFAPIDNPKIAIAVVVEHSTLAPKVARQVLDYYLVAEHKVNNSGNDNAKHN